MGPIVAVGEGKALSVTFEVFLSVLLPKKI